MVGSKRGCGKARGAAEFPEMRVIPVVVEIAAPGLTKIPVSDQVSFLSSWFTARSDRRNRLFQKIDAGASGLIVTIAIDGKTPGLPILRLQPQPVTLCHPDVPACDFPPERRTFTEVQLVAGPSSATKRKVDDSEVGETPGKLNMASGGGTTVYDALFWLRASGFSNQEVDGMPRKLAIAICALGLAAGGLTIGAPAQAQGIKVGVLTCNVASGFGFIFGSSRAINCTFSPSGGGPPQHYVGSINKFGVDIGYLQGGVIVWAVVAPTANRRRARCRGPMPALPPARRSGSGLGANVLIGGSGNSVALQPVSIEGTTGLNVAAGIAEMTLTFQPG